MNRTDKKYAVFTMDVEAFADTECVRNSGTEVQTDMFDGLDAYIRLLEKHSIRATMFTVCKTADRARDRLTEYLSRGHSIALHGYNHTAPMLISDDEFRQETLKAKASLEESFGIPVLGYRAPCFSLDNRKLDILRELGFRYDSSRLDFPGARHSGNIDTSEFSEILHGVFRRNGFYEFGISCQKIFGHNFPISGGGYVRLSNWGFIKTAIERYVRRNNYYVFYLHPFELSNEKIPVISNLKLYDKYYLSRGLSTYALKIETIIRLLKSSGYTFVTFDELADIIENEKSGQEARTPSPCTNDGLRD